MIASAANLPLELYAIILAYIDTDAAGKPNTRRNRPYRDIANCSLVCLDWAYYCRPQMFVDGVYLRSQDDLDQFIRFLRQTSRLPCIAGLISRLQVQQDCHFPPWYHQLCRVRTDLNRFNHIKSRMLMIHDSTRDDVSTPPSPAHSWTLPRSLPLSIFPYHGVVFKHMHLHSLPDLRRLIRGVQRLHRIEFDKVSWTVQDIPPIHLYIMPDPGTRPHYTSAAGCTNNVAVCLQAYDYVISTYQPQKYPLLYLPLAQRDGDAAHELVLRLFTGCSTFTVQRGRLSSHPSSLLYCSATYVLKSPERQSRSEIELELYGPQKAQQGVQRIHGIVIRYSGSPYMNLERIVPASNWTYLGPCISRLLALRAVLLVGWSKSELKSLLVATNGIVAAVPALAHIARRYAYHSDPLTLCEVGPDRMDWTVRKWDDEQQMLADALW